MAEKNWGDLFKNATWLSISFAEKSINALRRMHPFEAEVVRQSKKRKNSGKNSGKNHQGRRTRARRRKS